MRQNARVQHILLLPLFIQHGIVLHCFTLPFALFPNQTSASELEELTARWRKAAQEVAEDISSCSHSMHEQPVNVGQLLNLLRIPHSLLRYSEEEETFTD